MALQIAVPGRNPLELHHMVLDVNGTLAVDGVLIEGVAERLAQLRECLEIHLITADTHGRQQEIDRQLGVTARRMQPVDERHQKFMFVNELGHQHTVAIGNGCNDAWMLEAAAVGIAVLGTEGLNTEALRGADVVVLSILDALDLLLRPRRLIATLRR
jgi:P-type E1-E2 ATPase